MNTKYIEARMNPATNVYRGVWVCTDNFMWVWGEVMDIL